MMQGGRGATRSGQPWVGRMMSERALWLCRTYRCKGLKSALARVWSPRSSESRRWDLDRFAGPPRGRPNAAGPWALVAMHVAGARSRSSPMSTPKRARKLRHWGAEGILPKRWSWAEHGTLFECRVKRERWFHVKRETLSASFIVDQGVRAGRLSVGPMIRSALRTRSGRQSRRA